MKRSIEEILKNAKTIAIIGCSTDPYRTSHHIAKYLQNYGYRIIPVNPEYEEVLGEKCYPTLRDIPEDVSIDVVDIFRNSRYTAEMIDTVIDRVKLTGHKPVVWTQLGVSSQEAKEKAANAGLQYIEERCIMVEHRSVSSEQ